MPPRQHSRRPLSLTHQRCTFHPPGAAIFNRRSHYDCVVTNTCGSATSATAHLAVWLLGDLNCDDHVDFGDINVFVLALSCPTCYLAHFPNCDILNGDCDNDGYVDFGDINPFVALLSGGG